MAKQKPNYYEILEIDSTADIDTIRNAYRNMAKIYHPDTCDTMSEKDAEEMFKLINEAYKVLSDSSKKEKYDRTFFSKPKEQQRSTSFSAPSSASSASRRSDNSQSSSYFDSINNQRKFYYGPNETVLKLEKFKLLFQVGLFLVAILILILIGVFFDKAIKGDSKENTSKPASSTANKFIKKDYFTLGSSKDRVEEVMGTPSAVGSYAYEYDNSSVFFDRNDKVIGWNNINNELKVFLANIKPEASPIKMNSTKKDVLSRMGTPTFLYKDTWKYGKSTIKFNSNGLVSGWNKI